MAAAGVTSVRLFPEWRGVEPRPGEWRWDDADALVKSARENGLAINGILMGSPPGTQAVHAFPMDDLDGWAKFVAAAVGRYKGQIHHWEVWNEGNGGFNDGKHTTADYAKLVAVTYAAAKQANPEAQIGLSVASYDAPYLEQTIRALAKSGQPNAFDFLAIHPYEIADGLANPDGEIPFLWMTHRLREMLKSVAPQRAGAEIWITEVSRRIDASRGITEEHAAQALVKIYTMSLAQGISRAQWFEAQDPEGEDQGFGLLARDGKPRASYTALKTLTGVLGPQPKYVGWIALGPADRGYGFVFEGKSGPVFVAWMPKVATFESVSFDEDAEILDALSGQTKRLPAKTAVKLTDAPLIASGPLKAVVEKAKLNASLPFPWCGEFRTTKTVSLEPGSDKPSQGIFLSGRGDRPAVKFADGWTGVLLEGDIEHPISFFVHPSFAKFDTHEYWIRVTVRRVGSGNVGMNLLYEIADSQERSPYVNTGTWFGTSDANGWQTYTWHIKDASFAKMWGNDFTIRPEQSIPFVLGKVEVSVEPLK